MKIYPPITIDQIVDTLGITIKHDNNNKLITFLAQLSAYTDDSQLNLSFNAPSSSGKSFIPTEVAKLFPKEDIIELGYASPTSFFHHSGDYDEEKNQYLVNLERKILILLDQPHPILLEHLRPLLSHDKKEIEVQITDKSQKHGLRTKKVILRGYPVVIFCSAGLRMDEQEATRFLLLSPEVTQEKLHAGIHAALLKASDDSAYWDHTEVNPARAQLRGRIKAIRDVGITSIRISTEDTTYIEQKFFSSLHLLKPRHQRDIKRLVSIVKVIALLNLWHRSYDGTEITATREDIDEAFAIWEKVAFTQELNIPPYVYRLYEEVIVAAFTGKNTESFGAPTGITRQDIMQKHYEVYGRPLDSTALRQQLLPMLTQAGLIKEERDPNDKRIGLISPVSYQNNSVSRGGVNEEDPQDADELIDLDMVNALFPDDE